MLRVITIILLLSFPVVSTGQTVTLSEEIKNQYTKLVLGYVQSHMDILDKKVDSIEADAEASELSGQMGSFGPKSKWDTDQLDYVESILIAYRAATKAWATCAYEHESRDVADRSMEYLLDFQDDLFETLTGWKPPNPFNLTGGGKLKWEDEISEQ